jgi:hypothetical protein
MILKNPIFIAGLVFMVAGNSWFVIARFKELLPEHPFSAFGILPMLLIPPATAIGSFGFYKVHKGTKIPIWLAGIGFIICLGAQALAS